MTDREKKTIQELRMQGEGYKAIATALGMTRDRIRGYCKRHGLMGEASLVRANIRERIRENKSCAQCGAIIKQPGRGRLKRFCSTSCRRTWWKEHPEALSRKETAFYSYVCPRCGKAFKSYGNRNRKYCSHDCFIKARFYREEEERQPRID